MNIPVNSQIIISEATWVELEALSRFYGDGQKKRSILESAVSNLASDLLVNPEFAKALQEVRKEGVTKGRRSAA